MNDPFPSMAEPIDKVAAALVKAQKAFAPALKTNKNDHFKSKYADLASCVDAVIGALNDNGIYLLQRTYEYQGGVSVETVFIHESGQQISGGRLSFPASKQDPQGYMGALTYLRRGSLMAACGHAPEDDDANRASAELARERAAYAAKAKKCVQAIDQALLENRDQDALMEYQGAKTLGDEFLMLVWGDLGSGQRRRLKEMSLAANEPIKEAV